MRKVLLTSSQVSVLATAAIVVLSTMALFLSGYAIQQRTLKELRAAIRPRESPKAHLPEYFQRTVTKLDDGTIVLVESEAEREARELQEPMVIEVEPSTPEIETPHDELLKREEEGEEEEAPQNEEKPEEPTEKIDGKPTKKQMEMLEKIQAQVAEKSWAVENPDPISKNKAPLTRAERRKMIRDEIRKLSQSDKPVYYQRRLW